MAPIHSFGPFRYDSAQRLLFRDGEVVPLVPKAADTLHVLLERRGTVVEKAELMKLVWPDTNVEEIGLARNISLLRKALGDAPETYIETVPRRGYRFVGEPKVRRLPWKPAAAIASVLLIGSLTYWQFYLPSRYLPRGDGFATLAVVPFDPLGGADPALPREMHELLAAELSKLPGVQVISPSTIRRYQNARIPSAIMARILRAEVILEGTIQKTGGRTRITARLADVHSGKLIWAETYETPAEPGQSLAQTVAAQVGAHLAIRFRR